MKKPVPLHSAWSWAGRDGPPERSEADRNGRSGSLGAVWYSEDLPISRFIVEMLRCTVAIELDK